MTNDKTTRYCTLYRIGYWNSLDAECRTERDEPFTTHNVRFRLINMGGESLYMDFAIFTEQDGKDRVYDENGGSFPDLATAIRDHAQRMVELKPMPGKWTDRPARHDTWQGTTATAFA